MKLAARPQGTVLVLIFCALLAVVANGCGPSGTVKRQVAEALTQPDYSVLQRQVVVRVVVAGIVTTSAAGPHETFPIPGFRLQNNTLLPHDSLATLAGTEMPWGKFRAWLNALSGDDSARILLSTEFLVTPGVPNEAAQDRSLRYLANWRFAQKEPPAEIRKRLYPGVSLVTCVSEIPGHAPLLVDFTLRKSNALLQEGKILKQFVPPAGDILPDLTVQLPMQELQRFATITPVRNGHAMVLAHFCRQYHQQAAGKQPAMNIASHLLYLVSVQRVGQWLDLPLADAGAVPPARCALDFTWSIPWDGDAPVDVARRPGARASDTILLSVLDRRDLSARLRARAQATGNVTGTLGMVVADSPALFEMAETSSYVVGLAPPPSPKITLPCKLDIRTAKTGILLEATRVPAQDDFSVSGRCRIADPYLILPDPQKMLSVRRPEDPVLLEKFFLSRCVQTLAEGAFSVVFGENSAWQATLPWREDINNETKNILPQLQRQVFFSVRPLPIPRVTTTAEADDLDVGM